MPNASAQIELIVKDKRFAAAMTKAQTVLKRVGAHMEAVAAKAKLMLLAGGAALAGFVKLAATQEKAVQMMEAGLRATGDSVEAWSAKLQKSASAMQEVTTYGDEYILQQMSAASALGIHADKLEETTRMAIALSKVMGTDLKSGMRYAALAMKGETTMLRRYIPALRQAKDAEEEWAAIQAAVARGWKLAQAEAETTAGKFIQLKNALGDTAEKIGEAFLPQLRRLVEKLHEINPNIQDWVTRNQENIVAYTKLAAAVTGLLIILPRLVAVMRALKAVALGLIANPAILAFTALAVAAGTAYLAMRKANNELERTLAGSRRAAEVWAEGRNADTPEGRAAAARAHAAEGKRRIAEIETRLAGGGLRRAEREAEEANIHQQRIINRRWLARAKELDRLAKLNAPPAGGAAPGEPEPAPEAAAPNFDATGHASLLRERPRLLAELARLARGPAAEPVFSMAGRFESAEGVHRRISEAAGSNRTQERERRKLEAAEENVRATRENAKQLTEINDQLREMRTDPDGTVARFS